MTKEGYIENIQEKLFNGEQLEGDEISCVMSALYEANNCFQEPYYEVIYHDEFDNTERRIMEPVSRKVNEEDDKWMIVEDHFDLRFRRIEKQKNDPQN